MIEAIVLGSGTSNGVPMLGVEYPPDFLANPKNHRARSSLVLKGPGGNLLIDCAPEMRLQLLREKIMRVDSVIITHTHADHIMGMDDLRSFCIVQRMPMPVITLPRYQEDIRRIFPYAFQEFPAGIEVPRFEFSVPSPVMQLCGMEVKTFLVEHGKWPVIGLRVNNFAYLTDVSHIPPDSMAQLKGLDVLILDAVRYKPHPNHFHFEKALEVAQEIGAKSTYLTHLSHDYDHDKVEAELPAGIRLSYDGLRLSV